MKIKTYFRFPYLRGTIFRVMICSLGTVVDGGVFAGTAD